MRHLVSSFRQFQPLTTDNIVIAVQRLPDKSSAADPIPTVTSVLKRIARLLVPFFTELFYRSLSTGQFLAAGREAFITPIMKNPGLDATTASLYRQISNLSVLSKLLERLIVHQLMEYLSSADLIPPLPSGF